MLLNGLRPARRSVLADDIANSIRQAIFDGSIDGALEGGRLSVAEIAEQLAVSPDGTQVYVANEDAGLATVLDVASGKVVETFKIGDEPEGVSVEPVKVVVAALASETLAAPSVSVPATAVVPPAVPSLLHNS